MTPRRLVLALALLVLPALASAQSSKADAFAGKIPPVSGQLFRPAGRLELTLGGQVSLNDAFFTKYFGNAKLTYHAGEFWSVGGFLAGGAATQSGSAVVCSATTGCADATDAQLWQVPGRINMVAGLEGAWIPVYGKLNVLAEQVAHFDLFILAGPDVVFHDEVLSAQDAAVLEAAGGTPGSKMAFGGHFGVGARLFFAQWGALRLEVRDLVYAVDVPNNGGSDLQNQIFAELGFSVFFPTRNRPAR
jgi:outer membrane beta-barrel protein